MLLQILALALAVGGAAAPPSPRPQAQQQVTPPPAVAARPLLDAGLSQAKREDKTVFLWFSAEW